MKKLIVILSILSLIFIFTGCSSENNVTNEDIEDVTSDELLTEEIQGEWQGVLTIEANVEQEVLLSLDEDNNFSYQVGDVSTEEENRHLLSGYYEVDGDILSLTVTENLDDPDALITGDVTDFRYELSTDYLTLETETGEIINLTRVGLQSNQ